MAGKHTITGGLAVLVLASAAASAPVVFDNSGGEFTWHAASPDWGEPGNLLDLSRGPDQPYEWTADNPGLRLHWPGTFRDTRAYVYELAADPETHYTPRCRRPYNPALTLEAGDLVGPELDFAPLGLLYISEGCDVGGWHVPSGAFYGARVAISGRWHYGWLRLYDRGSGPAASLQPLSWGFETEPGEPIRIPVPEPSAFALAVLAICGAAAARSRKRFRGRRPPRRTSAFRRSESERS